MSDNPLLKFVKERLDAMPPEKRQKFIKYGIVGGAAALVIGIYYMTGQDHKKPPPPKEAASVVELGDARMEDDIRAQVAREHQEIEGGNKKRDEKTKEQQERIEQQEAQIKAMQGVLTAMSQGGATGLPDGKLPSGPDGLAGRPSWRDRRHPRQRERRRSAGAQPAAATA